MQKKLELRTIFCQNASCSHKSKVPKLRRPKNFTRLLLDTKVQNERIKNKIVAIGSKK